MNQTPPLVVIGTVAIDAVATPLGSKDKVFGGSAAYFSYAASFFTRVGLVAVVGDDFPKEYRAILEEHPIDLTHLKQVNGKTFSWKGRYGVDLNSAETLETHLNVLTDFSPEVHYSDTPSFLFLANVDPALQLQVLDQLPKPKLKFVACDTMNFWIHSKRRELIEVIGRVDCLVLNDGEARDLTGESNLVRAAQKVKDMGPQIVVIKKGEHGVLLSYEGQFLALPAYPLETVFDPTGAGDTFAGGLMGYLSSEGRVDFTTFKRAIAYGSTIASFTVENFGLERLRQIHKVDIEERLEIFRKLSTF